MSLSETDARSAQVAIVLEPALSGEATRRVVALLEFLGIPGYRFRTTPEFLEARTRSPLQEKSFAVIAPLSHMRELLTMQESLDVHSFFFYPAEGAHVATALSTASSVELEAFTDGEVELEVTRDLPNITGPMHGVRARLKPRLTDRVVRVQGAGSSVPILKTATGSPFLMLDGKSPIFISGSSHVPDLDEPLVADRYDVKEDFLSAVPLVIFFKWAFRDVCWQPHQPGACLIIDDPLLKTKYGCCDFLKLETQMRERNFSTSIAMIPWNWRRSSSEMVQLIGKSAGRLSISVHGCDHTAGEFGATDSAILDRRVAVAKHRMASHEQSTGIKHDLVMVFPQGVFSRESLRALRRHGFLAAVNSDATPVDSDESYPTLREAWEVAIVKDAGVPLYLRRYPSHGLENFAFDLLLGKPCLIVEHHKFFRDNHRHLLRFIDAINSLNSSLCWSSLENVIRNSYLEKKNAIRDFTKDATTPNNTALPVSAQTKMGGTIKVAARRYLSELRDNVSAKLLALR